MTPLLELEVLAVDCQATAAAPRGHLLEIAWTRVGATIGPVQACLIALPHGERIPPAVARITGISPCMLRDAVAGDVAWRKFSAQAAALARQPAPTIVHFARFEQPFLRRLAGGATPLDVVCTHEIARRLLPDLPRRSLRAVAGYFGHSVNTLRRGGDHAEATALVWRELLQLLAREGVSTWGELREWIASPMQSIRGRRRVWPMPRETRLALPDAPGVYRLRRTNGDVLYIGKATCLRHRVNSYFRKQHGVEERLLEMLSQARTVSYEITPSALEAALLEADEIKRHNPPYNIALTTAGRALWFTPPDLSMRTARRSSRCPLGPFPAGEMLDQFGALARGERTALTNGRWGPDAAAFTAGYRRFLATHPEISRAAPGPHARLLQVGTRLWKEGRRDRDDREDAAFELTDGITTWTPDLVQASLERLTLRAALARRRAIWFTRLMDAAVLWCEPGLADRRLLTIENGEIVAVRDAAACDPSPPIPPGCRRPLAARHEALTVTRFDRLRVLTIELKRLVAADAPVALRFGAAPALTGARLVSALSWV